MPILDIPGCDRFDPDGVPTLVTLTKEINDLSGDVKSGETRKQTSLWPYLEGFNKVGQHLCFIFSQKIAND